MKTPFNTKHFTEIYLETPCGEQGKHAGCVSYCNSVYTAYIYGKNTKMWNVGTFDEFTEAVDYVIEAYNYVYWEEEE